MNNFEWQQGDEGDWDVPESQPTPDTPKSKRRLAILAIMVLASFAAGFVIYRQVNNQLQQTETAVQSDILASHNLVQTAASSQDKELLLSVLSGRMPSWTDAQQEVLSAGVLFDRTPWGLPSASYSPMSLTIADLEADAHLSLSPDLREAELHFPLTYQFATATGISETVVLSQTAVYRQGQRNWLLSPPDSEFWGTWQTDAGERLTLIYSERDADLAAELAFDLEGLIQQICEEPDLPACAEDASYTIRLDTHPESLIEGVDSRYLDDQPYLKMPSPTLLGMPVDDLGYDALVRAYSVPLATAVIADLFDWECCRHAPIFQVLVDYQLDLMGIQPWPVTDSYFDKALRQSIGMEDVGQLWTKRQFVPVEEGWYLYAAVDFLFSQYPDLTPSKMLDALDDNASFPMWLGSTLNQTGYPVGAGAGAVDTLSRAWWRYAYTQTLLMQEKEPPPISLPEQDVLLLCASGEMFEEGTAMSLIRYHVQNKEAEELLSGNQFFLANPLLDDNGIVVQTFDLSDEGSWQTEIWRLGGGNTIFSSDDYFSFSLGQFDPSGRYAVIFTQRDDSEIPQANLLNLDSCDSDSCEVKPLSGFPYWSESGEKTIVSSTNLFDNITFMQNRRMVIIDTSLTPESNNFWLGDSQGQLPANEDERTSLGNGYAPFWLDEETIGYIRYGETDQPEVVLVSLTDGASQTALTLSDVQAVVSDEIREPESLAYVLTHPARPNFMIVVGFDVFGQEAFVFSYDLESEALALLTQASVSPYHSLGFSPNGRWLMFSGTGQTELGTAQNLHVYDLETNETQAYMAKHADFVYSPFYDWSSDGNWLLFLVDNRVLSVAAPEYEYQLVFAHEHGPCNSVAWINND
jgi:hypothetical protein